MVTEAPQNRALVVDDDDNNSEVLAMLLRQEGYEAQTASSAFAALEKCETCEFDLIISDIGMPEMNGYELARKLRSLPEHKRTVMIAITGFTIHEDRNRALRAGFDGLVTKPIGFHSLIATIERLRRVKK